MTTEALGGRVVRPAVDPGPVGRLTESMQDLVRAYGTQAALAMALRISPKYVSGWAQGTRIPNNEYAALLDEQASKLLGWKTGRFRELANECRADIRRRHKPPTSLLQPGDLVPLSKVGSLRWEGLTPAEQESVWGQFRTLRGQAHAPLWLVAGREAQIGLQRTAPIDLEPLHNVFLAFGLSEQKFGFPFDEQKYAQFRDACNELVVTILQVAGTQQFSERQRDSLQTMLSYLRVDEAHTKIIAPDVVVVLGTRAGHERRAERAADIVNGSRSQPTVILCGQRPSYVSPSEWALVSEADALHHVMSAHFGVEIPREHLIIDDRPRSTWESVQLIVPQLHELRRRLERPITVCVVTAPFSMRRTIAMFQRTFWAHAQVVGLYQPACSLLIDDLATYFGRKHDGERRREVDAYIGGYAKLIGGRIVGEY